MNTKGGSTLKICEQKLNYLKYSINTKKCYLNYTPRTINNYLTYIKSFLEKFTNIKFVN